MKKSVLNKMLGLMFVLLCTTGLVACSKSAAIGTYKLTEVVPPESKMIGTYQLTSIEAAGLAIDWEDYVESVGGDISSMSFTLEIKEDGSFTLDASSIGADITEGTWTDSNGILTLTAEGSDITAEVKDNTLVLEDEEGVTMTFSMETITTYNGWEYLAAYDIDENSELLIKEDGSFTLGYLNTLKETITEEGTWTESNDTFTLTLIQLGSEQNITATLKDNTLILSEEDSGMSMTFTKE